MQSFTFLWEAEKNTVGTLSNPRINPCGVATAAETLQQYAPMVCKGVPRTLRRAAFVSGLFASLYACEGAIGGSGGVSLIDDPPIPGAPPSSILVLVRLSDG